METKITKQSGRTVIRTSQQIIYKSSNRKIEKLQNKCLKRKELLMQLKREKQALLNGKLAMEKSILELQRKLRNKNTPRKNQLTGSLSYR